MSDTRPITVRVPIEILESLEELAIQCYPQPITGRQGSKGFDLSKMTNDVLKKGIEAFTDGRVSFPPPPKPQDDPESVKEYVDAQIAELKESLGKHRA